MTNYNDYDTGYGNDDADSTSTSAWSLYVGIVIFTLCMQAISSVALIVGLVRLLRRVFLRRCRGQRASIEISDVVAVVVPCFLPNEAPIIKENIRHLMCNMVGLRKLQVFLVYNTPKRMSIEEELSAMAQQGDWPDGRELHVEEVRGSKSKAENLNHIIPRITANYTVIYDADHQPDPDSLAMAVDHLQKCNLDCVQGSTYIRQGSCLLKAFIHAEFFVCYFVLLPMMELLSGTGFFGGANGVWRTTALQKMEFDPEVLTEDIDFCVRSILKHQLKFAFLPESRSGELAPGTLGSLWKQRLRWAMGWDQVSTTYASAFCSPHLSCHRRVGLFYIFICRWLTQFCTVIIVVFNMTASIASRLFDLHRLPPLPSNLIHLQRASADLYCGMIAYVFIMACVHEPALSLFLGLGFYFLTMPAYLLFSSVLLFTSLVRVARGRTGGWVVTVRSGSAGQQQKGRGAASEQATAPLLPGPEATTEKAAETQHRGSQSLAASFVLALGLLLQGATFGSLIGLLYAQHAIEKPLWGWVPFGIGASHATVLDGGIVARGTCIGTALAVVLFLALILCPRC